MKLNVKTKVKASALPTVIVVTVLMTLTVLVLISQWELESLFFVRSNHIKHNNLNIRSGFELYQAHPDIISNNEPHTVELFDNGIESEITIRRDMWGLYEKVSISSANDKFKQTRLLGLENSRDSSTFYYVDNKISLTATGNTNITGFAALPRKGIIYGQMRSVFFNGDKIDHNFIRISDEELPKPVEASSVIINGLFELMNTSYFESVSDSLYCSFFENNPLIIKAYNGNYPGYSATGNIILVADNVEFDSFCNLKDVLVVGNKIRLKSDFKGSGQFFATDSLIIEKGVCLEYPSGLYSSKFIEVGDNSQVNGYVIVNSNNSNVRDMNFKKSRSSTIRGLTYIKGVSQFQGIALGRCFLSKAMYFAKEGYYKDIIFDATFIQDEEFVMPLWLSNSTKRKTIKHVL